MSKNRGVSGNIHNQQQLNHYANQNNSIIQHIKQITITTLTNVILIIQIIKDLKIIVKKIIKQVHASFLNLKRG